MAYCSNCLTSYVGSCCPNCQAPVETDSQDGEQSDESGSGIDLSAWPKSLLWGIGIFIVGIIAYLINAPQVDQINTNLGQLAASLNPEVARQFQGIRMWYHFSIVAIIAGVLLILIGAFIKWNNTND